MLWTFAERISAQLVTLVVSVVLARLLSPEEYAPVTIVMVFVTIANVFVTSGFGSALIQKIDADSIDFSSTLYFSVAFSLILYAVLFFGAPLIADFYDMAVLTDVVRILSLRLVFAAINSVQQAYVAKTFQFKKFFLSTLLGTVASAIVGIGMAYAGFGVWAIVMQYLTNVTINTTVLAFTSGFHLKLVFSWGRMKGLYSYGWKIMVSDLINKSCEQARGLLLGKFASPTELSFYDQGQKFPALVINNVETSMQKVLAPIISNEQRDLNRVLELTRKSIRVSTFFIWPLLFGMAAAGNAFIDVLYTSKWAGCVPYLQTICATYLFYPVGEAHVRTIKALGKSDVFLKTMIVSQTIGIVCLFAFIVMKLNAMWIVLTLMISMGLLAVLTGLVNRKLIGYKLRYQADDLIRTGVCCLIMSGVALLITLVRMPALPTLIVQIILGVVVYVVASWLINRNTLKYCFGTIQRYIKNMLKR